MNIQQLKARYVDDPQFNTLVRQLVNLMETVNIQPYEVRDAAFLAELLFRETHIQPFSFCQEGARRK